MLAQLGLSKRVFYTANGNQLVESRDAPLRVPFYLVGSVDALQGKNAEVPRSCRDRVDLNADWGGGLEHPAALIRTDRTWGYIFFFLTFSVNIFSSGGKLVIT